MILQSEHLAHAYNPSYLATELKEFEASHCKVSKALFQKQNKKQKGWGCSSSSRALV
jgi:hypothetical protein